MITANTESDPGAYDNNYAENYAGMEAAVHANQFKYFSSQVLARARKNECFYQLLDHNTSFSVIWHVCQSNI